LTRRFLAVRAREEQALRTADERIAAFVKAQESIRGVSNADPDCFSDKPDEMVAFAEPQRARSAEI